MLDSSWLWVVFTVIAAAAQTVRNATQRELTAKLGTVGATHVRFLFGFPFALVFLAAVMIALGQEPPRPPPMFWPWVAAGALTQVAATALMLAAMNDRSFVVVYAYIKTEPVQVALFGLIFLGDVVTPAMAAAILIATTGVVIMALKPRTSWDLKATLLGLAAGAMFALSAVGFRGAILRLGGPSYVMGATVTVVVGLLLQSVLLSLYLRLRNPTSSPRSCALGGHRCSRASWVRSPPSSGSSPSRSPPPPACARWRSSRCCSRKRSRVLRSSRRRHPAKPSVSC